VRKALLVFGIALGAICLWAGLRERSIHRLALRAYYRQAPNAREGMPVCVDGVEVGSVSKITVRPELGDRPVEVVMKLHTRYELRIPSGSIAELVAHGVLGPTVVDIDTRAAHGPPVANGGTVEGGESKDLDAARTLDRILKSVDKKVDEIQVHAPAPGKSNKPAN
jgi:ABC-type transporter Mla subunit MlaD